MKPYGLGFRVLMGVIDPILAAIKTFKTRVLGDSGTLEAETCLNTRINLLFEENLYSKATFVLTPNAYKVSKIYSIKPVNASGDLSFSRAGSRLRRNSSDLIETLSNNIPRLNYPFDGGCPHFLFEPQRTNLFQQSRDANVLNNIIDSVTYVDDFYVSPDGGQNACRLVELANNNEHGFYQYATVGNGVHTISVFTKLVGRRYCAIQTDLGGSTVIAAYFDLQTGTVVSSHASYTVGIRAAGDGWFKIWVTGTATAGSKFVRFAPSDNGSRIVYFGSTSIGNTFWEWSLEAGASPSVFWLTTTVSSVTRLQDSCLTSGVSSSIGQTEGTLYLEVTLPYLGASDLIMLNRNTTNSIVLLSNADGSITARLYHAGSQINLSTAANVLTQDSIVKIAFAYKSGDLVLYVNGTQRAISSSTFTFGASLSEIELSRNTLVNGNLPQRVHGLYLFNTRLLNTELAALTTP